MRPHAVRSPETTVLARRLPILLLWVPGYMLGLMQEPNMTTGYHFSSIGRMSISFVKALLPCVCKFQYASAMSFASILASGGISFSHSFVLGMSITPSMMACATCTPLGANSFAILVDSARIANLDDAKLDISAFALMEAVAPVKINVGGCFEPVSSACLRSSGITCCEKRKAPLLYHRQQNF